MRTNGLFMVVTSAALLCAATIPVAGQLALAPVRGSGQTVTPVFEGWYENPDGTYSISFGYFNRNSEEVIDIPVGPDNFVEPGELNQGQPTRFHPRRHWGVFAVNVPADFGDAKVVWTIKIRGETFSIPGSLKADWLIDALKGEVSSGNTPPTLQFEDGGAEGRGPGGITAGPIEASLGKPLQLTVWAADDGTPSGSVAALGRANIPVTLHWFKHQGPGEVTFDKPTAEVNPPRGQSTTAVTFSEAGDYVLRVRANDASGVSGAGHAQCCWTNGFVEVVVGE